MNLFVIYIGGQTEKSLIELHDMRFIIAPKIEDTYDELKKSWLGTPESLHLDCCSCFHSGRHHASDPFCMSANIRTSNTTSVSRATL